MQVMNNNSINNSSIPTSRSFTFADEDETKDEIDKNAIAVTPCKSKTAPVSPTTSSDDNALSPSSLAYSLDSASPVKKLQTMPPNSTLLQTPPASRVMLTPTKIKLSPSGMDDVHPLATINKTPIQPKEVDDKHPSLFANTVQINKHKISPELSELTTTPTQPIKSTIVPQASNGKLNMKQQVAMNNFLKAQTSGNPIAKNEKWKELVYAMKESETSDSPTTKQYNNRLSSTKSTTGSRYSKGSTTPVATKDYNAILGTLTINTPGGLKIGEQSTDGISLSSGLTSKSDSPPEDYNVEWGSINMWNPSPQPTPKKSGQFANCLSGEIGAGGNKQLTYRTVTPPNVPILSKGDDNLPIVSPLSVDGSFDDEEENGMMDTTGETTMSTPEELKLNIEDDDGDDGDGDKKKEKKKTKKNAPCFFNLGESFADNTKRIWTTDFNNLSMADLGSDNDDVGSPDNIGSPVFDPSSGGGVERRTSSRTLSPLLLPSPRRSESPIVRGATFDTTKEVPSFSLGQPQVVVQQQQQRSITASVSSSVASGSQLVCASIEGEVMSYQDMEEQSSLTVAQKEKEIAAVFGDFSTQDDVVASPPPADVLPKRENKSKPSVVASAAIQELSASIPLTRSEPTLNPPPTTSSKRRTKTTTPSLEEQILSVIKQQPESHVVEEDKGEETFGRSSPLPPSAAATPSTSTKPKKKKKKSGTVGSTASAQDILKELRSSTASGKYSGSLHSGGYSGTSLNSDSRNFLQGLRGSTPHSLQSGSNNSSSKNKKETPPLGSISARLAALEARHDIGVGSAEQVATPRDQAANTVSRSPSDEDKSADQVGVKLPPSKRDVPRPNRISRRSVSEPTPVATELKPAKSHGSTSSSSKSRDTSADKDTQADIIHPPVQANPEPPATSRISRLFPNTTPKPTITSGGTPPRRQSTNPFDDGPSTNPFDSPPRRKVIADKSLGDPFDEQSSPIPVERSGVASEHSFKHDNSMDEPSKPSTSNASTQAQRAIAPPSSLPPRRDRRPPLTLSPSRRDTTPSPFRAKTSASPQTTKSSSSSEYIDELRATISQLKSVGVGGHGKPTSTLVRNEQTGRFVIRDLDDDNFKVNLSHDDVVHNEAILPEEISTLGESYIGSIEENIKDQSSNVDAPSQKEQQSFEEKPRYNPLTQIIDEEGMDEAAVDAAVQAATMECMSTSSTISHDASIEFTEEQQQTGGCIEEEDDFFVVRKPTSQSDNGWSGFASFAKEDSEDDFDILPSHSWADDKDDDFATGWDDSGFEETMWTPVAVQKKAIFSSPTSVATSKQTVTF